MNTPLRPLVRNDYPNFESTQHRDGHHHSDYANYHRPLNEVHHAALHGWGIAYGLEIHFQAADVLNVSPGVAIDSLGRMIVLAPEAQQGHWTPETPDAANRVEPSEVRNLPVALTLNQEQMASGDQYLTLQYAEVKYDEGLVDRIEVVPSIRLQPTESVAVDGTVIVLATIKADGSISHVHRQLIGQSTGGLTIQHSASPNNTVIEVAAGIIGPGDNGGLSISLPQANDTVTIGSPDTPAQLRVNGSMAVGDEVIIDSKGKWIGDKAGLQGEDGKDGRNGKDGQRGPGITAVQVATGAPGTKATARLEKITGDAEGDQRLHLQIPQGEKGAPGPSESSSWVDGKKSVSTDAYVGIGTDKPERPLHIKAAGLGTDKTSSARLIIENAFGNKWFLNTWAENVNKFSIGRIIEPQQINDLIINRDGNIGIGTENPEKPLHIRARSMGNDGSNARMIIENRHGHKWFLNTWGEDNLFSIGQVGVSDHFLIDSSGNIGIGTNVPQGKLDVNGPILQRGRQLHADYVFEPDYHLLSIDAHAESMWINKRLGAVPPSENDEQGKDIVDIGLYLKGVVEELEMAHIYIEQLHQRIKALETQPLSP